MVTAYPGATFSNLDKFEKVVTAYPGATFSNFRAFGMKLFSGGIDRGARRVTTWPFVTGQGDGKKR